MGRYAGAMALGLAAWFAAAPVSAEGLLFARPDPLAATSSDAARREAVQSIPIERLDEAGRQKVAHVLRDVTLYRRMPIRVIDCDPNLYLFLMRNPDVVVNIWQVLDISRLELNRDDRGGYDLAEPTGTKGRAEFVYRGPDLHVLYTEGTYRGPFLGRPIDGRSVLVVRSGYVREPNNRYYITTRLDAFVQIDDPPTELLAKTAYPLVTRTAESNFEQTLAFVSSLSRTAEINHRGVQRLASRLTSIDPSLRTELAELAAEVAGVDQAEGQAQRTWPAVGAIPRAPSGDLAVKSELTVAAIPRRAMRLDGDGADEPAD